MIAIGSHFYPSQDTPNRVRCAPAPPSWQPDRVVPVNLQFADEDFDPKGFRTLRVQSWDWYRMERLVREELGDARLTPAETVVHAARQLRARFRYARLGRATRSRAAASRR